MYTQDIHSDHQTVDIALKEMDIAISFARKDKDRVLCLIVGYGSHGKTHKIRSAVEQKLDEYKSMGKIKGYISGGDLDLFSSAYLAFSYRDRIPESAKRTQNMGAIYVVL